MLTTDQKGAIAEMAIVWEATKQGSGRPALATRFSFVVIHAGARVKG
jgi:hypothetical protein